MILSSYQIEEKARELELAAKAFRALAIQQRQVELALVELQDKHGGAPQESPVTQSDWVVYLLRAQGPLKRDDLFAALKAMDKAPSSPDHLSAVLSKLKKIKILLKTSTGQWAIKP